jgi:FkbM family methyltransferase
MTQFVPNPIRSLLKRLISKRASAVADQAARRALSDWSDRDAARLQFYRQLIPEGSVVFDVGANVGNRSKVFVRLGGKVVSVEPQERCAKILETLKRLAPNLHIIHSALGSHPAIAPMFISDDHTLSTLSPDWVDAMKASGRFGGDVWSSKTEVRVRTLDDLIAEHGSPSFIKIDVEGFEEEVLNGLTSPVRMVSIEFTPERMESSFRSIERLAALGIRLFNFGYGEETGLRFDPWIPLDAIEEHLRRYEGDTVAFGDIYARAP